MQVEEVARAVSDEHVTEGGGVRLGVGTETAVVRAEGHVVVEWVQSACAKRGQGLGQLVHSLLERRSQCMRVAIGLGALTRPAAGAIELCSAVLGLSLLAHGGCLCLHRLSPRLCLRALSRRLRSGGHSLALHFCTSATRGEIPHVGAFRRELLTAFGLIEGQLLGAATAVSRDGGHGESEACGARRSCGCAAANARRTAAGTRS
mmetsp:Transcript_7443/g.21797  ORF Transcript_7443/g.21797 Transcript_7443/m.21797 type:complete len:205 (-) Transcript_7443:741-1355(-)